MRVLAAVAALAIGVAGCGGSSHMPTASKGPTSSYDRASDDPAGLDSQHVRTPTDSTTDARRPVVPAQ
jgi:hypothetical protein